MLGLIIAPETRDWIESVLATTDTANDFYDIKDRRSVEASARATSQPNRAKICP